MDSAENLGRSDVDDKIIRARWIVDSICPGNPDQRAQEVKIRVVLEAVRVADETQGVVYAVPQFVGKVGDVVDVPYSRLDDTPFGRDNGRVDRKFWYVEPMKTADTGATGQFSAEEILKEAVASISNVRDSD
jgi:hypothetical protein